MSTFYLEFSFSSGESRIRTKTRVAKIDMTIVNQPALRRNTTAEKITKPKTSPTVGRLIFLSMNCDHSIAKQLTCVKYLTSSLQWRLYKCR